MCSSIGGAGAEQLLEHFKSKFGSRMWTTMVKMN